MKIGMQCEQNGLDLITSVARLIAQFDRDNLIVKGVTVRRREGGGGFEETAPRRTKPKEQEHIIAAMLHDGQAR
jgi:hypothetical protein